MKRIVLYIAKNKRKRITVLFLLSFISGITVPFITSYESELVNAVTSLLGMDVSVIDLVPIVTMLAFLYLLSYLIPNFIQYQEGLLYPDLDRLVKEPLISNVENRKYEILEDPLFIDKWNRIMDKMDDKLKELLPTVFGLTTTSISVFGMLIYVLKESREIALLYSLILIALFYESKKAANALYTLNKQFTSTERRIMYMNNITNKKEYIQERKIFNYTPFVNTKRIDFMYKERIEQKNIDFKFAFLSALVEASGYIATIIVMIIMFSQLKANSITIGFFIAFSRATLTLNNTMQYKVKNKLDIIAQQRIFWSEFWELVNTEKTEINKDFILPQVPFRSLEFRNVSFSYPNGTEVLKDISFKIESDKHYALVGENGCGKSTIVKLILGFYEPTKGKILLNGKSIQRYSQESLTKYFSVVFQDFAQYAVTFKENITLGNIVDKEVYDDTVLSVGLAAVKNKLPYRDDTILGRIENTGVDLSGGEWQKAAMARALCKQGEFVILDEPTASMDPIAESNMYSQFNSLMRNRGTIFISHRLASATLADKIFVIKDKKVCESGTHQELINQRGYYYIMFNMQKKWYWKESM